MSMLRNLSDEYTNHSCCHYAGWDSNLSSRTRTIRTIHILEDLAETQTLVVGHTQSSFCDRSFAAVATWL